MKTSRSNGQITSRAATNHVLAIDQATNCCSNISTVAELLEACGNAEIDASLVVRAGGMISDETEKLRQLLKKLHDPPPRSNTGGR